ncbi:MAG: Rho termination factor N-terminal domain-containing protein, partial [Bacteroidales bacterium]|nr:Rho termination factor N-terminal domain-containing protein [Bacteroidales bacterium]
MYNISELSAKTLEDLQAIAQSMGIAKVSSFSKDELVYKILDHQAETAAIAPKRKTKVTKTKEEKKSEASAEKSENTAILKPQPKRMISRKSKQKTVEVKDNIVDKIVGEEIITQEAKENTKPETSVKEIDAEEAKKNVKRGRRSIIKKVEPIEDKGEDIKDV